jgi:hypothetical protein
MLTNMIIFHVFELHVAAWRVRIFAWIQERTVLDLLQQGVGSLLPEQAITIHCSKYLLRVSWFGQIDFDHIPKRSFVESA